MNNPIPSRVRELLSRLRGLFVSRGLDSDFEEEIESHLQLLTEENTRRGLSPGEAKRQARLKLGSAAQLRETHHAQRTLPWLESLLQDTRFALRMLRKNPGFTVIAVITLALGIGVNATLFSVYDAVALKPLPVADPARVVRFERWLQSGSLGDVQYAFSYPEFAYVQQHSTEFSALVAASRLVPVQSSLAGAASTERLAGQLVSANYFTDFGIRPLIGRAFAANEDQTPGANPVIVISYAFWRRAFLQNQDAIGSVVALNGSAFTIVGVAPKEFTGTSLEPQVPDFWVPLSMQAELVPGQDWLHQPLQRPFQIFGRLNPSVSRQAAQPQADLLIRQFSSTYLENDKTTAITLQRTTYFPNTDDIRFRALVAGMMLIVGLILFVACVNVGNMLLARGAVRHREISTRRALGATRTRIVRQLLAESILLASLGGVAGVLVSAWTTDLLGSFLQRNASLIGGDFAAVNLVPDWRVMLYALAISVCAGTVLGLSPALQLAKQNLAAALKTESGALGKVHSSFARSMLIGAQVAASILLLAMAGLLTRGLVRAQTADPGFDTRDNYLLYGNFGNNLGTSPLKVVAGQIALVQQMQARPEFQSVALGSIPYTGTWTPPIFVGRAEGRTLGSYASDTYFDQLGITLIRGRSFTPEESNRGASLAVISESLARSYWPKDDPLGKTFALDMNFHGKLQTFQVIGVAGDIRFANLTRVDSGHVYLPVGASDGRSNLGIILRTFGNPNSAIQAAQSVVSLAERTPNPGLHLLSFDDGLVKQQRTISGALATIATILAALAFTLAGVGIYGVLSYLVSQRTKEIGVRVALGATPAAILKDVIVAGLRPVFVGVVIGVAAAGALSTVLHRTLIFPGTMDFLYGVPFYDPVTFVGLFCFALVVAVLAGVVPARRAMRVDPMVALRYE